MIIECKGNLIFNICFENLIVSINNASNIFLSDIGDSLRLNEKLNKICLLNLFLINLFTHQRHKVTLLKK